MTVSKRTPTEVRLLLRAGALQSWANTSDPVARTAPARKAAKESRWTRFANEIDPERQLPPAELERRIDLANRAYMARLAAASVASRRIRAGLATAATTRPAARGK